MKLKSLIKNFNDVNLVNFKNIDIEFLEHNLENVKLGTLFFCINGQNFNGELNAESAVLKGAVAIVSEHKINVNVPQIIVNNTRIAMAQISKTFYDCACDKLKLILVTGTNGKTSVTYILNSIFASAGIKSAIIGTNGIFVDNKQIYYGLTTPDPIDLHYNLLQLKNLGVKVVIMEASAHAIKLNKLYGIYGEAIIYTNLTNEHLDFFKTMDEYSRTKIEFINNGNFKLAVVNSDDEYANQISNNGSVLTYGLKNPSHTFAVNIKTSINGSEFFVNVMDEVFLVKSHLTGIYNVYNLMAAITCAYALGISPKIIANGIEKLTQIPGRFNVVNLDCGNKIIIDFAHTPDGFSNVLSEIKNFRQGKIITLFGCVGYSDSLKRRLMGKIANEYSDELIITSDNPNYENFNNIINDILKDVNINYCLEPNREKAIEIGFNKLTKNCTLVLLGKGAETSNLINGKKVSHNDLCVVEKLIEKNYGFKKSVKEE